MLMAPFAGGVDTAASVLNAAQSVCGQLDPWESTFCRCHNAGAAERASSSGAACFVRGILSRSAPPAENDSSVVSASARLMPAVCTM